MSESDPGVVRQRTAGEVGARRHAVGEAVPPEESNSLNVPPSIPLPLTEEDRRRAAELSGGGRHRARKAVRSGSTAFGGTAGSPRERGAAAVEKAGGLGGRVAGIAGGRRGWMWAAAGVAVMFLLRRVLRGRHG